MINPVKTHSLPTSASEPTILSRRPSNTSFSRASLHSFKQLFKSSSFSDHKSLSETVINKLHRKQLWQEKTIDLQQAGLSEIAVNATLAGFTYGEPIAHINEVEAKVNSSSQHKLCRLEDFRSAFINDPLLANLKFTSEGIGYDKHTGLLAALFYEPTKNQFKLVFGGTHSGKGFVKPKHYRSLSAHQLTTDLKNLVGSSVPKLYLQTSAIVNTIKAVAKDIAIKNKVPEAPLLLLGHSLGGAMAQYAAIKHGLKAIGYSSAALGHAALLDLAKANRLWDADWIKQHIEHYFIEGDPVCNPAPWKTGGSFRAQFSLTNLGTRHIIPPQSKAYSSYLGRHSYAEQHILLFIDKFLSKDIGINIQPILSCNE
ncbi:hypothetical protein H0A36_01265 [Endozoicomonas sp. SM1973]|uniref:Thioesterase domain-containing protein n=1 Tax=Spartinivicinus marinus TaxID=2994442 RepID=A0A853IB18_9GAMM|nr:thioesterase domain-containing protein [Spartinivicinus marinus]MCX4026782.1 hypothetical protein [Spartinivicinus marinus]NYZ64616.1 hypothetical protein [Spartinivicinus marinus]